MYEKLKSSDDLYDHEVLEILLYSACPRINTNPLAHALLDRFVTLNGVFSATVEQLMQVDGVGESVANFIKTVGLCAERAGKIGNSPTLRNMEDCKRFIDLRLRAKTEEFIELYFVNKAGKVQRIFTYTSSEKNRATVDFEAVASSITVFRPYGIIIAHNHINSDENPSDYDDRFTRTVQFICNMNGVILLDHIIYCNRELYFSFKDSGRLDKLKDSCKWENFEKWIKNSN